MYDNIELDRLTCLSIFNTDSGAVNHIRVSRYHAFNFVGKDVKARDYDHVFDPVDYANETICIDNGDITGEQPLPILGEGFSSGLGTIPVAFHHLRAFDAELAALANRHFVTECIYALERRVLQRLAYGT